MAARLAAYSVAFIVGLTVIAGLIVGAQRSDDGPVDLMVVNGRVYTADGKGTTAEAVAIQGNKILRVGTTREIQRLRRAQTVVIDAKGGTVLPGFIETNAQLFDTDLPADSGQPAFRPALPIDPQEDREIVRAAAAEAHRRGVTSIQDGSGSAQELDRYDELRRQGLLTLRVYGSLSATITVDANQLDSYDALREKYADDPLFKAGAMEIALSHDTSGGHFTPRQLNWLVGELDRRGWQIVIRADDDRDLSMAADAYGAAIETNPAPARGRRHRIEPDEIVGPIDFSKFDKLGVVHPTPVDSSALRHAIDAITREAAWISFDEQRKGTLARDMLADVIVLTTDIFALPSATLHDAEVSVTIFDGRVVFQRALSETDN